MKLISYKVNHRISFDYSNTYLGKIFQTTFDFSKFIVIKNEFGNFIFVEKNFFGFPNHIHIFYKYIFIRISPEYFKNRIFTTRTTGNIQNKFLKNIFSCGLYFNDFRILKPPTARYFCHKTSILNYVQKKKALHKNTRLISYKKSFIFYEPYLKTS
jgi:hypothetical protein